jgi:hypothetical protein
MIYVAFEYNLLTGHTGKVSLMSSWPRGKRRERRSDVLKRKMMRR